MSNGPDTCPDCGTKAETATCSDCGTTAKVIDCKHSARPLAIDGSLYDDCEPVCQPCEAKRAGSGDGPPPVN